MTEVIEGLISVVVGGFVLVGTLIAAIVTLYVLTSFIDGGRKEP